MGYFRPQSSTELNWRRGFNLLAVAGLISAAAWAIYVHFGVRALPYDDGFITYRYVDHALANKGLVYNEGQRVFGSTTPLYTLLLTALRSTVTQPTPELAVHFNVIPFLACAVGIYLMVRKQTSSQLLASFGTIVFLIDPTQLAISTGGMESHLFLAFALATLVILAEGRHPILSGFIAGLAILTRPEGVLLVPLLAWVYRGSLRACLGCMAALFLTLLPWGLFSTMYYGTPVPLSLIAKGKPLYPLPRGEALAQLSHRLEVWATGDLIRFGYLGLFQSLGKGLILGLLFVFSFACLWVSRIGRRRPWLCAIFFWLLLGSYAVGNPLIFDWYLPPFFALALLNLLLGFHATGQLLDQWSEDNSSRALRPSFCGHVGVACVFLWLTISSVAQYALAPWGLRTPIYSGSHDPTRLRIIAYRQAAERMKAFSTAGTVIGASEIGSFGFYSNARILDFCGLVSPEVHPFLPVPADERFGPHWGAIGTGMVRSTMPDYIVTMPIFAAASLGKSEWFFRNYEIIDHVPLPAVCWGSSDVLIFKRKS